MFRKFAFFSLLAFGILCLATGRNLQRALADVCKDQEPDLGIYCPVRTGDNPNATCETDGNATKALCDRNTASYAKPFYTNYSYTKSSPGFYPQLQFDTIFMPEAALCYVRTRCIWNTDTGKCESGASENVYQFKYVKTKCAVAPPPPPMNP